MNRCMIYATLQSCTPKKNSCYNGYHETPCLISEREYITRKYMKHTDNHSVTPQASGTAEDDITTFNRFLTPKIHKHLETIDKLLRKCYRTNLSWKINKQSHRKTNPILLKTIKNEQIGDS
ncbi:hypothetical protein RF11_05662 [Thelohanellus kitauei]|uniref:Uncharacterized protein n=1 Tax=Thelohanellus kitauei TaxID=669202 RepID=A0A0C2N3T0_THEKT|nr:hypothetical protein RF11_05662 [Thelohanellus kitauei]